jgi:hypothetical protein
MKLPIKRILRWAILSIISIIVVYLTVLVGNPNNLEGKFACYEFSGHSKSDILEFEDGLVTMKTCCGASYEGDYWIRDGKWTWDHQAVMRRNPPEFRYKKPVKIDVEPHLFSITLKFEDGQTMRLPRRVFTRLPL